ncbi:MAG TPA: STAS/SEC14 domain-containing protein [Methanosarcina sp.]|nr:STAS/SEC14 domain-containing protein [Methanosarcina sp.]
MMELIKGLPDNVLGIIGSGTITGEDYDTVLIPAMKDKLQRHKKIRMLYQLNTDFKHYALDAYLEDSKVSLHILSFEKVAVVSDVHWINDSVNLFKFIISVQVKVFSNNEFDKAKAWVSE